MIAIYWTLRHFPQLGVPEIVLVTTGNEATIYRVLISPLNFSKKGSVWQGMKMVAAPIDMGVSKPGGKAVEATSWKDQVAQLTENGSVWK